MSSKHAKSEPKRRLWLWLLLGIAVLCLIAGAVWVFDLPGRVFSRMEDTVAPTVATTRSSATTEPTTEPTTVPTAVSEPDTEPEPVPVRGNYRFPEEMRGVWLTAGVDYPAAGAADACREAIDRALEQVVASGWNTVMLPLTEEQIEGGGFDAPGYLLEKAGEREIYVYLIIDCGVMQKEGRDPRRMADRLYLRYLTKKAVERYPADGVLFGGFSYLYGDLPAEPAAVTAAVRQLLTELTDTVRTARQNCAAGLLTEAVWAHKSVIEGGSATANVYEQLTDGGADTRGMILDGMADFVMVKDFRPTGDYSASFETVLNWWNDVCREGNTPLFLAHAASYVGGKYKGFGTDDQLARQVLACQRVKGFRGSCFDSLAALNAHPAAATAAKKALDGTLMEEYITRTLTVTSPASSTVTTNDSTYSLRGSADPNFPVLLNGKELTLTDHGYFTLDVALKPGDNVFTFENKGVTTTYTVHYKVIILKSIAPTENLTMDGESTITVSAVAHKGATLTASVGNTKIPMSAVEVQKEEGAESESDYVTYTALYTLPAGIVGEQRDLGRVSVTGTYSGQSATANGGTVTVKALPEPVGEKITHDIKVPDLAPIDPTTGETVLAEGTVLIIKKDYAETFSGDTTDDCSRPTNAYLPKGTTDILAGTAYDSSSGNHYYLLGCGRRVYTADAETYITGGTLTANTLTAGGVSVTGTGTSFTLSADWRVPFQVQLLPQKYGNPAKQDYTFDKMTSEYVEITFYYTTAVNGTPDVSGSPLFQRAEWQEGKDNTQVLRLYLKEVAGFYGYHVAWDNEGRLTFTFRHPTYVGGNDGEQPLKGFTVVLDPGHGGNSIGTAGGKLAEKTIVLTYSLLLKDKLEALGAKVVMTRATDTALSLEERTQITRASGADLFISIHMNGSTSAASHGCTVHYFTEISRDVAKEFYSEIVEVYKAYGSGDRGGIVWSPFYVCRVSEMPALLVECGYMTNAEDLERLITPDFQDAFTAAVTKAVVDYAATLPKVN